MGRIISIIRSVFAVLATVFWTVSAIVLYPFWRGSSVSFQYRWSRSVLTCTGVKVKVSKAVPIQEPVIFTVNHQSTLDILALMGNLQGLRFVSKIELGRAPLIGRCMKIGGHIFLDRGTKRKSVEALKAAAKDIREVGRSVVIFPEGTRFAEGELGPFKRGVLLMARASGLPVVPVGIVGTPNLMSPDSIIAESGEVRINIGHPIDTSEYKGRDPELIARLRKEIADLAGYAPEAGG